MFQNIDLEMLKKVKERDPEAALIIDTLLANHNQIISTISHEIRNPLTLVYSSLQLISSKYPETKNFKFWDSAIESVEFTKLLLEDLSDYNNSSKLNCYPCNISQNLRATILSYAISLEEKPVEITSFIPYGLPIMDVDRIKFREVILNLLKNAHDALEGEGNIKVTAEIEEDTLIITIDDDGYGMSQKQLNTIFEPFTTYKLGGTGLGLPISRSIIESHGGSLTATSVAGKGSTFTIKLPILPVSSIHNDCQEYTTN